MDPARKYLLIIVLSLILLMSFIIHLFKPSKREITGLHNLVGGDFIVVIDREFGVIREIRNRGDAYETNFARGEESSPREQPRAPWLGSVSVKYRIGSGEWISANTSYHYETRIGINMLGYSDESITFSYFDKGAGYGGFNICELIETYRLEKDEKCFVWEISLVNRGPLTIEVGEISIPMAFNIECMGEKAVANPYEKRVLIHPFIAGHSSYIYFVRPNGEPPFLLMVPGENTFFEAFTGQWSLGIIAQPPPTLYLFSKANEGSWKEWFNGLRSFTLSPGEIKTFRIRFYWVNSYREINEKMYEIGKVSVKVAPGMVIPEDLEANVLLECKKPILSINTDEGTNIIEEIRDGDRIFLKLTFSTLGQHVLRISYGEDEWLNLPFYSIKSIEYLMEARSKFIITYQRITDPNDIRQYAFLMWDSENDCILDSAPPLLDFGPGWPRPPLSWMNGCSDEIGFAEPIFLAEKNVYYPNVTEIKVMEDYIWKFLYGKLQDKNTYAVKRWIWDDPEPGTWRSFNYPHVFNIYYSMYKIAKLYNLTEHPARDYLLLAYNTAMTYHSDRYCGSWWRTLGNMGAWNTINILKSLREEGLIKEYNTLLGRFNRSTEYFVKTKYPYLSEFPFDTTGYESTYFFRKYAGRMNLVNEVVKVLLATLHYSPIWWWYGCDIKSLGVYTTAMNSRCLLDAYDNNPDDYMLLRIGYAGTLAYWSQVYPNGEACTGPNWSPDGSPGSYFNPAWSNEYGIGLYANLHALKAYVVKDPDFGLIGYGCRVSEGDDGTLIIVPARGIDTRIFIAPLRVGVEVLKAHIREAKVTASKEWISLVISKSVDSINTVTLRVRGIESGEYLIYTNEGFSSFFSCPTGDLEVEVPARGCEVEINISLL
ncbi:MAG: DUF5695 domain-containing protein [Candidatus Bathyarchaeia archaeon]